MQHNLNIADEHPDRRLIAGSEDDPEGLLRWSPQPWESEIIGKPVVRVDEFWVRHHDYGQRFEVGRKLMERFCAKMVDMDTGMTTYRTDVADMAGLHVAESVGFRFTECLLTFERSSEEEMEFDSPFPTRSHTGEDIVALREIARTSFKFSRLHSDPLISPDRAALSKSEWIENACRGRADDVFVSKDNNRPIGFIACKKVQTNGDSVGVIDLIAVDPEYSRRGVGRALVGKFVDAYGGEVSKYRVGTQGKNVASVKFYERLGFQLTYSQISMHRHYKDSCQP